MNETDHEPIVTIAFLAAMADGQASPEELSRLRAALKRLAIADFDAVAQRAAQGQLPLADVTRQLSGDDARRLAYETALVVCHADGPMNEKETSFLNELRSALGLNPAVLGELERSAAALAGAPMDAPLVHVGSGTPPSDAGVDQLILEQAILTGAVDLLPDRLANVAILPLQLRLVYQIGRHYGQQLDAEQIKDLAATLGLGAAAQVMEGVVRKLVGSAARGLLGGLIGAAGGLAAGVAVTFAATYALGHVAKQYYAQGRRLSADDLRALFQRFQDEARALFPKVQDQIQTRAKMLNLQTLLG
jgi:uncharacterized protein (DUF697 family)/tellurite resistance protein